MCERVVSRLFHHFTRKIIFQFYRFKTNNKINKVENVHIIVKVTDKNDTLNHEQILIVKPN